MGMTYGDITIDKINGTGTINSSTPRIPGSNSGNRHCAAWEETSSALNKIADALEKIDSKIGAGIESEISAIRKLAQLSIMTLNRGK